MQFLGTQILARPSLCRARDGRRKRCDDLSPVCQITIKLNIDDCLHKRERTNRILEEERKTSIQSMLSQLAEDVANLLKIPKKRGFFLDITLEQRVVRPRLLAKIITCLKPALEACNAAMGDLGSVCDGCC